MATDDDAFDLEAEHRELDRRHRSVKSMRLVIRRYEGAHVAHDEQVARGGTRQQVGHQAGVGAPDEQRGGMLPLVHQRLELLAVLGKGVVMEAAQTVQQLVGHGRAMRG